MLKGDDSALPAFLVMMFHSRSLPPLVDNIASTWASSKIVLLFWCIQMSLVQLASGHRRASKLAVDDKLQTVLHRHSLCSEGRLATSVHSRRYICIMHHWSWDFVYHLDPLWHPAEHASISKIKFKIVSFSGCTFFWPAQQVKILARIWVRAQDAQIQFHTVRI